MKLAAAPPEPHAACDPVARARFVAPLIAANADRIERERGLPGEVVDALHAARLYRLL